MPAATACDPQGDACAAGTMDSSTYASYRKDYYLTDPNYPEASLDWQAVTPVDGGRFHIVGTAAVSGDVTGVLINGQTVEDLLSADSGTPYIEWYHQWPDPVVAGEPVWVAFHSRSTDWDSAATGQIQVQTSGGDALAGSFPVLQTMVPLTYVTVTEDLSSYLS